MALNDDGSASLKTELGSKNLVDEKRDVFGDEANHDIQYKTLSWQVRMT